MLLTVANELICKMIFQLFLCNITYFSKRFRDMLLPKQFKMSQKVKCFNLNIWPVFLCFIVDEIWDYEKILNVFAFYTVTQLFLSLELYQSLLPSQPNTVSSARKNTFAEKSGEMKFLPWVFGLARGVAQPFRRSSKWNHNSYRLRDPAEVLLAFE